MTDRTKRAPDEGRDRAPVGPRIPRPEPIRTRIPDSPPCVRRYRGDPRFRMTFATGGRLYSGPTGHADRNAAMAHAEAAHALVVAFRRWRMAKAAVS